MTLLSIADLGELEEVAQRLTAQLRGGDVILLVGDLGAGKTTMVGALARALGCTEAVRSPTFTVAHEHALGDGRTIAHLDLYRAAGVGAAPLSDEAWADLAPVAEDAWVVLVEWPGPLGERLADRRSWRVELDHGFDETPQARLLRVLAPADVDRDWFVRW